MKTIFVAGLGRCGSSLTMQMLHRAGIDCLGEYPSFEYEIMPELDFTKFPGKAIKLLYSEGYFALPEMDCKVILLNRNHKEQAKSQAKLLRTLCGINPSRQEIRLIERSLQRDFSKINKWASIRDNLKLSFEEIIDSPVSTAKKICDFLEIDVSPVRVADVVISRSTNCYDGMLEATLI